MRNFIEHKISIALEEAKEELKLCNLQWKDSFYDCYNYTPDFDFGEEEYEKFFFGCMVRIDELHTVLTEFNR